MRLSCAPAKTKRPVGSMRQENSGLLWRRSRARRGRVRSAAPAPPRAALPRVLYGAGERPVELAELFDVEVEVLVVRVVVGVRDLHERHAVLQQPPPH